MVSFTENVYTRSLSAATMQRHFRKSLSFRQTILEALTEPTDSYRRLLNQPHHLRYHLLNLTTGPALPRQPRLLSRWVWWSVQAGKYSKNLEVFCHVSGCHLGSPDPETLGTMWVLTFLPQNEDNAIWCPKYWLRARKRLYVEATENSRTCKRTAQDYICG